MPRSCTNCTNTVRCADCLYFDWHGYECSVEPVYRYGPGAIKAVNDEMNNYIILRDEVIVNQRAIPWKVQKKLASNRLRFYGQPYTAFECINCKGSAPLGGCNLCFKCWEIWYRL
jgi:hypothetical protein